MIKINQNSSPARAAGLGPGLQTKRVSNSILKVKNASVAIITQCIKAVGMVSRNRGRGWLLCPQSDQSRALASVGLCQPCPPPSLAITQAADGRSWACCRCSGDVAGSGAGLGLLPAARQGRPLLHHQVGREGAPDGCGKPWDQPVKLRPCTKPFLYVRNSIFTTVI